MLQKNKFINFNQFQFQFQFNYYEQECLKLTKEDIVNSKE